LRLLRLLKLQQLLEKAYDFVDSEYTFIVFNMIRLVLVILMLNHIVACFWYLVGKAEMNAGQANWLQDSGNGLRFFPASFAWKYTTALHWSLTQFTPASMDVVARSVAERGMSIAVVFVALLAFSSVVGNVTASMTALRTLGGDLKKEFWNLRRYLKLKEVDAVTRFRILKYLEHHTSAKQAVIDPDKINILKFLSEPLQDLLAYEINARILRHHPFFKELNAMVRPMMLKMCRSELEFVHYAAEDHVFRSGETAERIWFVKSGLLEYTDCGAASVKADKHLSEEDSICEPTLFTVWQHMGELQADAPSECIGLKASSFSAVMRTHPLPYHYCQRYATLLVAYLNSTDPRRISDLSPSSDFYPDALKACSEIIGDGEEFLDFFHKDDAGRGSTLQASRP